MARVNPSIQQTGLSPRASLLFALWFSLIIPLIAFGVGYTKSDTPVVRVSGETINRQEVLGSGTLATNKYASLEQRAFLSGDETARTQAAAELRSVQNTWAAGLTVPRTEWNAVAVAPQNENLVVIAARRNVFISRNAGTSWEHQPNVLPSTASALAISPNNSNTMYAGIDGLGFYVSRDGGKTWQPSNAGIKLNDGARFGITAIAIDPYDADNMVVSAGVWLGTGHVTYHPLGILKSTDGGKTWSQIPAEMANVYQRLMLNGNVLYAWNGTQRTSFTLQ